MKTIITGIIILTSLCLQAQQQTLTHLNSNDIYGIFKAGKKAVCISFSEHREYDNKNILLLNVLGDEKMGKQTIIVDQGTYLLDVVTNTSTSIAVFVNADKEVIELISLDENGKISGQNKYVTDPNDLESYGNITKWKLSEDNILYLVRSYSKYESPKPKVTKLVNKGYQLFSLSTDAKLLGAYFEDGMEKPAADIKTIVTFEKGCVLFQSQNEQKKKTFEASLKIFGSNSTLTGSYPLSGVDFTYYPTDIIYDKGEIIAAGMYFKGLWHNAKTSEGLFFLKLNTKGEKIALNNQNWADIKSKIGNIDKKDFLFNGKTDFLVEAIEVTPTGYLILGESYAKSSGVSTAEFILDTEDNSDSRVLTIYDFIAIETDMSGMITAARTIKKENSNIRINGGISSLRNVELSFILKKYNKFPFQSFKNNQIHFISYKNNVGSYSVMDFKTGAIVQSNPIKLEPEIEAEVDPVGEEMIQNSGTLSKLDKFSKKMDNMDKKLDALGNKADYAFSKTDVVFSPGQRDLSGIIMMADGTSVYYIIHPETHTVYYVIM